MFVAVLHTRRRIGTRRQRTRAGSDCVGRSGQPWGKGPHAAIMLTIAGRLSTADIAAVASYIQGLHTAVPEAANASATAAAQ